MLALNKLILQRFQQHQALGGKPVFLYSFRKLSRPLSSRPSIISFTDNALFPKTRTKLRMFELSVWNLS